METKGVLFIKFDVSLYSEAECCTPAIKVGNLTRKARIPVLSTWSLGKKVSLRRRLSAQPSASTLHLQKCLYLQNKKTMKPAAI